MSDKTTHDRMTAGFRLRHTFEGLKSKKFHRIAWSHDGQRLAAPSEDGCVWIWEVESGELHGLLSGHTDSVISVSWSPDGKKLASASDDKTVRVWDVGSLAELHTLEGHINRVHSAAWSPDGRTIASGEKDRIILWNADDAKRRRTLEGRTDSLIWSPDGKMLASGGSDETVRLWNPEDGQIIDQLTKPYNDVRALAWSPDGEILASGSENGPLRVWEPKTGKLTEFWEEGTVGVTSLSFSADGKFLASKFQDGTIELWWSDTWESKVKLKEQWAFSGPLTSLAFHPTELMLAALGESDAVIHIWTLDLDVILNMSPWIPWLVAPSPDIGHINSLPHEGQGWPALRLRRLRLENIKCFDNFELDLREPDGAVRTCTAFVGDNATGKTALLQAIALGCLGPDLANQIEGVSPQRFLRHGAERGVIELEFELVTSSDRKPHRGDIFSVGLQLGSVSDFHLLPDGEMRFSYRNSAKNLAQLHQKTGFQWGFCCGYGALRGMKEQENDYQPPDAVELVIDRVLSLFKPANVLIDPAHLEQILQANVSMFSKDISRIPSHVVQSLLERLRDMIPGMEIVEGSGKRNLVERYDSFSIFSELSDGCNAMLGLLGHLTRHALELYGWQKDPFEAVGIVLIDEVELHLHPTWQRKILIQLQKAFPNLQFIVTTHSPLVLGGIPDGQVHVLERDEEGRIQLLTDTPSIKGWRVDQLLTGVHFDVGSSYDLKTEELMNRYAVLLNKYGPEHPEAVEIENALDEILLRGPGSSRLDREAWRLMDEFVQDRLSKMSTEERSKVLATLRRAFRTPKKETNSAEG
jgi:WD40 repeat protein